MYVFPSPKYNINVEAVQNLYLKQNCIVKLKDKNEIKDNTPQFKKGKESIIIYLYGIDLGMYGNTYYVYNLLTENRNEANYLVISPTLIGKEDDNYKKSFDCQFCGNNTFNVLDYSLTWKNTDMEATNDENTYIRPC